MDSPGPWRNNALPWGHRTLHRCMYIEIKLKKCRHTHTNNCFRSRSTHFKVTGQAEGPLASHFTSHWEKPGPHSPGGSQGALQLDLKKTTSSVAAARGGNGVLIDFLGYFVP